MPAGPVIRQATLTDASELARLRWDFSPDEVAAGHESFAHFTARFETFLLPALGSGDWTIWVAEEDERLIAHLYLQSVRKVPRPGRLNRQYGYVTNVYVEPSHRGQGVGRRLLAAMIAWARQRQHEFLILWPSKESVDFYQRAGFIRSPDVLELHIEELGRSIREPTDSTGSWWFDPRRLY